MIDMTTVGFESQDYPELVDELAEVFSHLWDEDEENA